MFKTKQVSVNQFPSEFYKENGLENLITFFPTKSIKKTDISPICKMSYRQLIENQLSVECLTDRQTSKNDSAFFICGDWNDRKNMPILGVDSTIIEFDKQEKTFNECLQASVFCRQSYSRQGWHIAFCHEKIGSIDDYREMWFFLSRIVENQLGVKVDKQTKNPNRVWFFDPTSTMFSNPTPPVWTTRTAKFWNIYFAILAKQPEQQRRKAFFAASAGCVNEKNEIEEEFIKTQIELAETLFPLHFHSRQWDFSDMLNSVKKSRHPETKVLGIAKTANKTTKTVKKKGSLEAMIESINQHFICRFDVIKRLTTIRFKDGQKANYNDVYLSLQPYEKSVSDALVNHYLESSRIEKFDFKEDFFKIRAKNRDKELKKLKEKVKFSDQHETILFFKFLKKFTENSQFPPKQLPILVSERENIGKSTLLRQLFSPFGDYLFEVQKLTNSKDDQILLTTSLLGIIDEIEVENDSALKQFVSSSTFQIRRPFARLVEECPRRSHLWGTANNFILDNNSSRFINLSVLAIDFSIDVNWQELWRELWAFPINSELTPADWEKIYERQNVVTSPESELAAALVDSEIGLTPMELYHHARAKDPCINMRLFHRAVAQKHKKYTDRQGKKFYFKKFE